MSGFSKDDGDSNENSCVKKQKVLKVKEQIFARVARCLVNFFAVHDHDVKYFYGTLFGGRNKHTMMIFFIPRSNLGAVPKDSTLLFICRLQQVGKTQKFEKTRIRFNSDVLLAALAINILKHPTFTNVTLSFWFYPLRVAHISEWKMITQG